MGIAIEYAQLIIFPEVQVGCLRRAPSSITKKGKNELTPYKCEGRAFKFEDPLPNQSKNKTAGVCMFGR